MRQMILKRTSAVVLSGLDSGDRRRTSFETLDGQDLVNGCQKDEAEL